jgi:hypothetical protein
MLYNSEEARWELRPPNKKTVKQMRQLEDIISGVKRAETERKINIEKYLQVGKLM